MCYLYKTRKNKAFIQVLIRSGPTLSCFTIPAQRNNNKFGSLQEIVFICFVFFLFSKSCFLGRQTYLDWTIQAESEKSAERKIIVCSRGSKTKHWKTKYEMSYKYYLMFPVWISTCPKWSQTKCNLPLLINSYKRFRTTRKQSDKWISLKLMTRCTKSWWKWKCI